jgi:outer membrane protein assembly factor BamB
MASLFGSIGSRTASASDSKTSGVLDKNFVDVNGLLKTPSKVRTMYSTVNIDGEDGSATFLDGILYTFSDYNNGQDGVLMQAWDQETGKKLWSLGMQDWSISLTSDGKHVFFYDQGVLSCLDKRTGTVVWKGVPYTASPFLFGANRNITVHINEKTHTADMLCVIGWEYESIPPQIQYEGKWITPINKQAIAQKVRNPGIWILDANTGKLLSRLDLPTLTFSSSGHSGELLCDGNTLYAGIPESTESEPPVQKSSLMAFDLRTRKLLWKKSVDGECSQLVKRGNRLVFLRNSEWIDVWRIGTSSSLVKRLWTHDSTAGQWNSFAADSSHVYFPCGDGKLIAFDLDTGREAWRQQFSPYKAPEPGDRATLHDLYPIITLTMTRGLLYVQDGGGLVVGFDPASGRKLWSKRISQVVWGMLSRNWFIVRPVDKGFLVLFDSGRVDLWK